MFWFIQVNLSNVSYTGTLFKVWFIQVSGLHRHQCAFKSCAKCSWSNRSRYFCGTGIIIITIFVDWSKKKHCIDYRLNSITWKNVINYIWLWPYIMITQCLSVWIFFVVATIELSLLKGKCQVVYSDNVPDLNDYFINGPDRFYFTEVRLFTCNYYLMFNNVFSLYSHNITEILLTVALNIISPFSPRWYKILTPTSIINTI